MGSVALVRNPPCPSDPSHGPTVARTKDPQTPEQLFCGRWLDCRVCTSTILQPSDELRELWAEQRRRSGQTDLFRLRTPDPDDGQGQ